MFRAHVYAGRVITVFPIVIVAIWARLSGRPPRWAIKQHSVLPGSRHSASCATSKARTGSSPRDGGQRSPTSRAPFAAPARYGRRSSAAEISGLPLTNTAAVSVPGPVDIPRGIAERLAEVGEIGGTLGRIVGSKVGAGGGAMSSACARAGRIRRRARRKVSVIDSQGASLPSNVAPAKTASRASRRCERNSESRRYIRGGTLSL